MVLSDTRHARGEVSTKNETDGNGVDDFLLFATKRYGGTVGMFLILVHLALIAALEGANNRYGGPFDLIGKEPIDCDDRGTNEICINETVIRKTGKRSFRVSTRVTLAIPITDEMQVVASFTVWGNGGWKPNYLTIQGSACSMFKEKLKGLFESAMRSRNLPFECPIPPGTHVWEDIDPKLLISLPALPYNRYKIHVRFYEKDGSLVGCAGFMADVVPAKKKTGS